MKVSSHLDVIHGSTLAFVATPLNSPTYMHCLLRDSIPYYESFLTSEKEGGRVTSGDAKDPLDQLEHRRDVTMTAAGSKKAAMRVCGISGKSIVENAAATHGSPECNPSRRGRARERAHAFRECGGVSQIERTILFLPSFLPTE